MYHKKKKKIQVPFRDNIDRSAFTSSKDTTRQGSTKKRDLFRCITFCQFSCFFLKPAVHFSRFLFFNSSVRVSFHRESRMPFFQRLALSSSQ